MSIKGTQQVKVADYRMSHHIGICIGPIDEVVELYFNNKDADIQTTGGPGSPTASITSSQERDINRNSLFGGDQQGGGIIGKIFYMFGEATQVIDPGIAAKFGDTVGGLVPSFRDVFTIFLCGINGVASGQGFLYGTNNAYIPPLSAKVRDYGNWKTALGQPILDGNTQIGNDMNPAHIIYWCLTDTDWGMGEDPSNTDQASYLAAAETLRNEGLGLAMLWDTQTDIEDFLNSILDQISAKHDIHPVTGLWTLKLLRGDYDVTTIPVLDQTNSALTQFQRKLFGEIPNFVTVSWTDPNNEQPSTVNAMNDNSIAIQGAQIAAPKSFLGVRSSGLAQQLADRELKTASLQLVSGTSMCDRSAWKIAPGDVVLANYPRRNVNNIAARVVTVNRGSMDAETIQIDWVQDVFGVQSPAFDNVGSAFVDNSVGPEPVTTFYLSSIPYYQLAQDLGDAGAQAIAFPQTYAMLLIGQPNSGTYSVDFYTEQTNAAGQTSNNLGGSVSPLRFTTLQTALDAITTTLVIPQASLNVPIAPGDFVLLQDSNNNEEIMLLKSSDGTNFTLWRGVLDTVPRAWPSGTIAWAIPAGSEIRDPTEGMDGQAAVYQFLPVTTQGRLDISLAPVESDTLRGRSSFPYRNANVVVAGQPSGASSVVNASDGPTPVTWSRRNRLTETSQILGWTDADVFPETGATTTIDVIDPATGTVLATHPGLTGTSFSLPFDTLPSGSNQNLVVSVYCMCNGLRSFESYDRPILFSK